MRRRQLMRIGAAIGWAHGAAFAATRDVADAAEGPASNATTGAGADREADRNGRKDMHASAAATDASGDLRPMRIVAAWRGADERSPQRAGVLDADWRARTLRVRWEHVLPTRAHGLAADVHGIVVASVRPGSWLLRTSRDGEVRARARAPSSKGIEPRFGGHTVTSTDGQRLYATMTDTASARGLIGVFDARTLEAIDLWPSHGIEPHQLLLDAKGDLLVAHGGIRRDAQDRKVDLDHMASSLVHLDGMTGALIGRWRLHDPRLSLRHLAWSRPAPGEPQLLGVALQAEHDDVSRRREAPALAVWDGRELSAPVRDARAQGYAGDIAAAHDGGFVISNHRTGHVWWWRPDEPAALHLVAQLREAYALTNWSADGASGALVAAARGIGRWHPGLDPALMPWPQVMALDNHWFLMEDDA
jgi:hypothetical protein